MLIQLIMEKYERVDFIKYFLIKLQKNRYCFFFLPWIVQVHLNESDIDAILSFIFLGGVFWNLLTSFVIKRCGVKTPWTYISPVETSFDLIIKHNRICIVIFALMHTHTYVAWLHALVLPQVSHMTHLDHSLASH